MRCRGHICYRILFKFGMEVYHDVIYKPIDFGCAAPSVPSFIGSKVMLLVDGLCALSRLHFLTDFCSNLV